MPRTRCAHCQSFTRAAKRCQRCGLTAKAVARKQRRAHDGLVGLQRVATSELWPLRRLLRAIGKLRRSRGVGVGDARWQRMVQDVFGARTSQLVDPRQTSLFASTERLSCKPEASPSPSLSPSA